VLVQRTSLNESDIKSNPGRSRAGEEVPCGKTCCLLCLHLPRGWSIVKARWRPALQLAANRAVHHQMHGCRLRFSTCPLRTLKTKNGGIVKGYGSPCQTPADTLRHSAMNIRLLFLNRRSRSSSLRIGRPLWSNNKRRFLSGFSLRCEFCHSSITRVRCNFDSFSGPQNL
jgi:hypothetical protein